MVLVRLVPIKMKSMVMTSYVLAIIIWSILAQTNPSKLSIILKFVNKNISTNHQRGKLSTNQGRPFIFADICCCFFCQLLRVWRLFFRCVFLTISRFLETFLWICLHFSSMLMAQKAIAISPTDFILHHLSLGKN